MSAIRILLIAVEIIRITIYGLACFGEEEFNKGIYDLFQVVINAGLLYFLWTYPIPV